MRHTPILVGFSSFWQGIFVSHTLLIAMVVGRWCTCALSGGQQDAG